MKSLLLGVCLVLAGFSASAFSASVLSTGAFSGTGFSKTAFSGTSLSTAALSSTAFCFTAFSATAFSFTAFSSTAFSSTPAILLNDTTKMVSGVPLKPEDISPLLSGENIPLATLVDADGKAFNLNAAVAAKPTILLFYRGGWCPYCQKELSGIQDIEADLEKMGYQVLAVSTDSPDNLKQTVMKQKLTYTLLSDADLALSKQIGIAYKSPKNYDGFLPGASGGKNVDKLLPVPSVFILNKKGNIRFEYINPNFTQRMSSALLKSAAEALYAEL